jgi:hypothetical protein
MKIGSNYLINNRPIKYTPPKKHIACDTVSFSALHSKEGKALFMFDLDGTFAHRIEDNKRH